MYMTLTEREEFLANEKEWEQTLATPRTVGGRTRDGGQLPEGFKDIIREGKKKNPLTKGMDHIV